jgi:ataxin-10
VLEECLGIWRVVTEREVKPRIVQTAGDVVTAACAMGLPRLLLALTTAMPPPLGAGQTSKASGPTAAPKLNPEYVAPTSLKDGHPPFPCVRAWPGYRVDCIAPLANAMFGRPRVCDQVFELGGCGAVLAATRGEDGDDYLREWALWGVRNLCAGSDAARREIEQMQPQAAADSQQLTAMGLNVEVDPETGKVRVGGVKKTGVARRASPGGERAGGRCVARGFTAGTRGCEDPRG